jgi:hypothetical protein
MYPFGRSESIISQCFYVIPGGCVQHNPAAGAHSELGHAEVSVIESTSFRSYPVKRWKRKEVVWGKGQSPGKSVAVEKLFAAGS